MTKKEEMKKSEKVLRDSKERKRSKHGETTVRHVVTYG